MKTSNSLCIKLLVLSFAVALSACNPTKLTVSKSKSNPHKLIQPVAPSVVKVKNYNQYNMTLQKLTGINRSKHNATFDAIKGSLPSDNEISGMTPFNLLAMSRLADAYCTDFVAQKVPASFLKPLQEDRITDFLMTSFLDEVPEGTPEYYSSLKNEIGNIFANDDGTGNKLFPSPSADPMVAAKDLTIAACVTILASPYITLLE